MGSKPKAPEPPELPPPPPPPPTPVDEAVVARRTGATQAARNRLRAMRTIMTSPQGLPLNEEEPLSTRRTILGR